MRTAGTVLHEMLHSTLYYGRTLALNQNQFVTTATENTVAICLVEVLIAKLHRLCNFALTSAYL